jgi:hypothetical protein
MKEGYWINYRSGKVFEITEHEQWIRDEGNARALGIPPRVFARFRDFVSGTDRDMFLLFLMKSAPVMRVRGHGVTVTFEFWSRSNVRPMAAIRSWAKRNAGSANALNIVNLAALPMRSLPRPARNVDWLKPLSPSRRRS